MIGNLVSNRIASLQNATPNRGDSRLQRAAAMVNVSNRVRAEDIPDLLQSAGKVIG